MSLFAPKKVTSFEIEADPITTENVTRQHLEHIYNELQLINKRITSLAEASGNSAPADEINIEPTTEAAPEVAAVTDLDMTRFNELSQQLGNPFVTTSKVMQGLCICSQGAISNTIRRWEHDKQGRFTVERVGKIGHEVLMKIGMKK